MKFDDEPDLRCSFPGERALLEEPFKGILFGGLIQLKTSRQGLSEIPCKSNRTKNPRTKKNAFSRRILEQQHIRAYKSYYCTSNKQLASSFLTTREKTTSAKETRITLDVSEAEIPKDGSSIFRADSKCEKAETQRIGFGGYVALALTKVFSTAFSTQPDTEQVEYPPTSEKVSGYEVYATSIRNCNQGYRSYPSHYWMSDLLTCAKHARKYSVKFGEGTTNLVKPGNEQLETKHKGLVSFSLVRGRQKTAASPSHLERLGRLYAHYGSTGGQWYPEVHDGQTTKLVTAYRLAAAGLSTPLIRPARSRMSRKLPKRIRRLLEKRSQLFFKKLSTGDTDELAFRKMRNRCKSEIRQWNIRKQATILDFARKSRNGLFKYMRHRRRNKPSAFSLRDRNGEPTSDPIVVSEFYADLYSVPASSSHQTLSRRIYERPLTESVYTKSAQKAFVVPRMIRRTFSRITHTDFQILHGACVRPLLENANPVVYAERTKDVILIERVQRGATKMVAGLKSVDYETRLAEYRRLRGDLILTYALFEEGLVNRFFTVDPANTRWGHVVRGGNDREADSSRSGHELCKRLRTSNPNSSIVNGSYWPNHVFSSAAVSQISQVSDSQYEAYHSIVNSVLTEPVAIPRFNIVIMDSITSDFNNDASPPYNRNRKG
ncbi:hypothetical protein CLF_113097 [Clonorchis sinensis]|uniref:Uncharacterized protein n=1 Tax=Clonorchis sinensis TaxID=79923 RepID=G7YXM4_CLOSI|nr:hypothetical protein CLF_113097 [Clonorchis sinensis]